MKKLYNKILIVVLALSAAFIASSCLEDNEVQYGEGPVVVRFEKQTASENFLQDGSGTVYEYEIPIEYKGANGLPLNEAVNLSIAVNTANSTAVQGQEFDLEVTDYSIPAGETSVKAVIKVYSENLDATDPKVVTLDIVSSSINVADNASTAITLQAVCPSHLAGTYTYLTGRQREVTLTETGTGLYTVSCDDAFRGLYSFNISDVCGNITVTGGFLEDNYGIHVSGYGTVNAAGDEITIYYTADGYLNNRQMVMKKN